MKQDSHKKANGFLLGFWSKQGWGLGKGAGELVFDQGRFQMRWKGHWRWVGGWF